MFDTLSTLKFRVSFLTWKLRKYTINTNDHLWCKNFALKWLSPVFCSSLVLFFWFLTIENISFYLKTLFLFVQCMETGHKDAESLNHKLASIWLSYRTVPLATSLTAEFDMCFVCSTRWNLYSIRWDLNKLIRMMLIAKIECVKLENRYLFKISESWSMVQLLSTLVLFCSESPVTVSCWTGTKS